jgi:hypothetical protein
MERFIVKPESISVEAVKRDLIAYLNAKPDFLRWKDFFSSSAGAIIIDFLAGIAAFILYHVVVARREAYLSTATNMSSNIGIAQNLSYSVFRGRNVRLRVTIAPIAQPVIINRWQSVGNVNDFEVIALESKIINVGDTDDIIVVVGEVVTESIFVDSNIKKPFRFKSPLVSDDVRLFQNGNELEYTTQLKDLIKDKHVLISNVIGAVDLYYLNNNAPLYETGDTFSIEFIRLANIELQISQLILGIPNVANISVESLYRPPETINEIKVNAPLYFETQFTIRGRNDFKKIFKALDSTIIDTNGRDYSSAIVELTYVRNDLTHFTNAELNQFLTTISDEDILPYGVTPSPIRRPIRNEVSFDIKLSLLEITNENLIDVLSDKLLKYQRRLGIRIDKSIIENEINTLPYVKANRVTDTLLIRQDATFYTNKQFIVENVNCGEPKFEFLNHIRKSSNTEPVWPLNDGDIITDGRVFWEARDQRICNLPDWEANKNYRIGDKIKPLNGPLELIFVVIATENLSNNAQPLWNQNIGNITYDNELIWQAVPFTGTPSSWTTNTNYFIGDTVIPFTNAPFLVQVVGFRSKSSNTPPVYPSFENIIFEDGDVEWISRNREQNIFQLGFNDYAIIKFNLVVS